MYREEILEIIKTESIIAEIGYCKKDKELVFIPSGTSLEDCVTTKAMSGEGTLRSLNNIIDDITDYRRPKDFDSFIGNGELIKGVYINIIKLDLNAGFYTYVDGMALDCNGNYYKLLYDCAYFRGRSCRDNRFIDINFNPNDCDNIFGRCYDEDGEGDCMFLYTKMGEYKNGRYTKTQVSTNNIKFIGVRDNNLYQVDEHGIIENEIRFFIIENIFGEPRMTIKPQCLHTGIDKKSMYPFFARNIDKFYSNKDLAENNITLKIDNCYYDYEEYTLEINILAVDHFKIKVYKDARLHREINIKDANYTNIARLIKEEMSSNISRTSKLDLF